MKGRCILECDIGNTRCKWRLINGVEVLQRGNFNYKNGFNPIPVLPGIERVRVSCVAGDSVLQSLSEHLHDLQLQLEIAVSTKTLGEIRNAYDEHLRLGVDRWLALIAAYKYKAGAVLILDAGSALTADVIDQQGQHLGGYIVPGIELMKSSLLKDTGRVRFEESERSADVSFGRSTADAVNSGVVAAQVGSVMKAVLETERRVGKEFAILITGGDAKLLIANLPDQLASRVEMVPELVLDGLQWVLP